MDLREGSQCREIVDSLSPAAAVDSGFTISRREWPCFVTHDHLRGQKSRGPPLKSLDFHGEPFEMALVIWLFLQENNYLPPNIKQR